MSEMRMVLAGVVAAYLILGVFAFVSFSPREKPVEVATESQFIQISPEILLELKPNGDEVFYTGRVQCRMDDPPMLFDFPLSQESREYWFNNGMGRYNNTGVPEGGRVK